MYEADESQLKIVKHNHNDRINQIGTVQTHDYHVTTEIQNPQLLAASNKQIANRLRASCCCIQNPHLLQSH